MSVVNSCLPCYRGAVVAALSKYLNYDDAIKHLAIWDYTLAPDPDLFPKTLVGNRKALIEAGKSVKADSKFGHDSNIYLLRLLAEFNDSTIETSACYTLAHALIDLDLPRNGAECDPKIAVVMAQMLKDTGLINPKDFVTAAERAVSVESAGSPAEAAHEFLTRLASKLKMHSVRRNNDNCMSGVKLRVEGKEDPVDAVDNPPIDTIKINYLPLDDCYRKSGVSVAFFANVLFITVKKGPSVIITTKDIPRIQYYLNARASVLKLHGYMAVTYNEHVLRDALSYFDQKLALCANKDRFAEAFVSASNVSVNGLAGFLSKHGYEEMSKDHIAEGLETIIQLPEFLNKVSRLKVSQHRAFRSIVRIAMPPSYDVPGIFSDEKKLHNTKNGVGAELKDDPEAESVYLDFLAYNRLAFCRQFHKQYGRYPGKVDDAKNSEEERYNECVLTGAEMTISLHLARRVNLRGCLAYQSHTGNLGAHFKDTAMAPHSLDASELEDYQTNQMAYMATAQVPFDLERWRSDLGTTSYKHYHKVGFKNEVAKEKGRLFFISELGDKLLLGELEDNIGSFLKNCPGNAVGAPPGDVANSIFMAMCKKPIDGQAKLLISDDISKWSPYMPVRVQQDSADFWSEVFDQEWISRSTAINRDDLVVLDTAGWKASYPSHGSNKEGQTGKQMSYLMTNLKAFAVAKCRGKYGGEKLFSGAVNLLTFLDDGFTAADIDVDRYKEISGKVLKVLIKVQEQCGFIMKLKKSFPSDRYCQFLSREYYMGGRVYDYVKSVTKRAMRVDELVTALPEDIREVTAWATGATESGTPKEYVYACYLMDCARTTARKLGKAVKADPLHASFLLAPVAGGGAGVMPPHGVVASLVKDMYTEQLEVLRKAAHHFPAVRAHYARIVNAEVKRKSGRGILRAHKTVTLMLAKMSEQRVTRAIEDKFLGNGGSCYVREMVESCNGPLIEEFGVAVARSNQKVLGVNLDDLYESSPLKMYDSILAKFKKSATLTAALGKEVTRSIIKAYKDDACKCFDVWCSVGRFSF